MHLPTQRCHTKTRARDAATSIESATGAGTQAENARQHYRHASGACGSTRNHTSLKLRTAMVTCVADTAETWRAPGKG